MWSVIVCDSDNAEREQIFTHANRYFSEIGLEAHTVGCTGWPELAGILRQVEPDVVIVAQNGVEGLDIITSAKILSGKILWFSDLDFGLQAYRLCVAYFCKKPVTYRKVERAFTRFLEYKSERAMPETTSNL